MHQLSTFRIRSCLPQRRRSTGGCVVVFPALRPATGTFVDWQWCLIAQLEDVRELLACPSPSRSMSQPNIPPPLIAHFLTAS